GLGHLAERYPDQLSGGQQQRVAICRALIYEPRVMLLDEPLSNLDAKLREEARYWIRQLILDLELCAVLVTHDQNEALATADQIILLRDGEIVQTGDPLTIYREPRSFFTADFLGANNIFHGRLRRGGNGAAVIEGDGWSLHGTIREEGGTRGRRRRVGGGPGRADLGRGRVGRGRHRGRPHRQHLPRRPVGVPARPGRPA